MNSVNTKIVQKLVCKFGDSINIRGAIIEPQRFDLRIGTVRFTIIDRSHPEFGKNSLRYEVVENGNVELKKI